MRGLEGHLFGIIGGPWTQVGYRLAGQATLCCGVSAVIVQCDFAEYQKFMKDLIILLLSSELFSDHTFPCLVIKNCLRLLA